jgi:hypothetical protein
MQGRAAAITAAIGAQMHRIAEELVLLGQAAARVQSAR